MLGVPRRLESIFEEHLLPLHYPLELFLLVISIYRPSSDMAFKLCKSS